MRYESIPELTSEQVGVALERDDPDELGVAVLAAALYWDEVDQAEALCLRLARHDDPNVRGNAVLGLGHLVRRRGRLSGEALAAIEAARSDVAAFVRGQAESAWEDAGVFSRSQPSSREGAT